MTGGLVGFVTAADLATIGDPTATVETETEDFPGGVNVETDVRDPSMWTIDGRTLAVVGVIGGAFYLRWKA